MPKDFAKRNPILFGTFGIIFIIVFLYLRIVALDGSLKEFFILTPITIILFIIIFIRMLKKRKSLNNLQIK